MTVRSSPIAAKIDRISVCHHCHRNCKQKISNSYSNSLKVQHSQSSSSKCCSSHQSSQKSLSSIGSVISKSNQASLDILNNEPNFTPNKTPKTRLCNKITSHNTACECNCKDEDFKNVERTTYSLEKATCKLLNSVLEIESTKNGKNTKKSDCYFDAGPASIDNMGNLITNIMSLEKTIKKFSSSHANPAITLDPFNEVPKIAVVPPTPDAITSLNNCSQLLYTNETTSQFQYENEQMEISPEDSPDDLPYTSLNSSLKRYGTIPSLERIASEDTDDRTCNSSETDGNDDGSVTKFY